MLDSLRHNAFAKAGPSDLNPSYGIHGWWLLDWVIVTVQESHVSYKLATSIEVLLACPLAGRRRAHI